MKPDRNELRASEEWTGHASEARQLAALMGLGFAGILLLGVFVAWLIGVVMGAWEKPAMEESRGGKGRITTEEIEGRNRHGRVVDER